MTTVHLKQYPDTRPKTRGECADMPRPCPFLSCRHHLAHDWAKPYYGKRPTDDELTERIVDAEHTCSLDVADKREHSIAEVAEVMQTTESAINKASWRAGKHVRSEGADGILDSLPTDTREAFDLWAPSPGITMKGVDF